MAEGSVEALRARARLEHASPGRARARIEKQHRTAAHIERARRHLQAHPSVSSVDVNPQSGSVLVQGTRTADLQSALREALDIVTSLQGDPQEAAVQAVVNAVTSVDDRVRQLTDGRFSVRLLIPSLFVGVGIRQLLREGFTLGTVPWYVLLYYGVDSFLKLYPEHAPAVQQRVSPEQV